MEAAHRPWQMHVGVRGQRSAIDSIEHVMVTAVDSSSSFSGLSKGSSVRRRGIRGHAARIWIIGARVQHWRLR